MMIDPLAKAEECDRAIETCTEAERLPDLTTLRELWITIGNHRAEGRANWEVTAEDLDRLHADIVSALH